MPYRSWKELYCDFINKHYLSDATDLEVGVGVLSTAYRNICPTSFSRTDVDYKIKSNRFAYLYLYGPCHSAAVESLFTEYIISDQGFFTDIVLLCYLNTGFLKMCSLGGGAGCDLLGLREAARKKTFGIKIDSVVIDKYAEWACLFSQVSLLQEHRGNRNSFIMADLLTSSGRNKCKDAIASANIVCLIKFISVVLYTNHQECLHLIQFILNNISSGALLLFIDNAGGGFFETVNSIVQKNAFYCRYLKSSVTFCLGETPYYPQLLLPTSLLTRCKVTIAVWQKA